MKTHNNSVSAPKGEVLLLSTFHFQNPSLDAVKNRVHNVSQKESQEYLDKLSQRLSEWEPTKVLLEYNPNSQQKINGRLQSYLTKDNFELSLSEVEQIGFRVAKRSGLNKVNSFDNRETPWLSEDLLEEIDQYPIIKNKFEKAISEMSERETRVHSNYELRDILIHYNSREMDHVNKSLYLLTNQVGAEGSFSGANAAASWWHRNFKMLAIIQKYAKEGERVLVVGGQGHIAVIRELIAHDSDIKIIEVKNYL